MFTANLTFSNSLSFPIRHFQIPHNTPCLPSKTLHNLFFSIFLDITVLPRETNDNVFPKFWGANKVYWGGGGDVEMAMRTTEDANDGKHVEIC